MYYTVLRLNFAGLNFREFRELQVIREIISTKILTRVVRLQLRGQYSNVRAQRLA